jgi:hypothetical protein
MSIGTITVPTPIGTITFYVVLACTLFLLCIQDMDRMGVHLDNTRNMLVQGQKTVPIIHKFGYPFLVLYPYKTLAFCHLIESELRQIHWQFRHPSVNRLAKILQRSGHEFETCTLQQIKRFCHHCQMHKKAPGRFRFTLQNNYKFNYTIVVDIMYLDRQ